MLISDPVVRWFLVVANVAFWVLIGVRIGRGSSRRTDPRDDGADSGVAAEGASSRWARLVVFLSILPMAGYGIVALLGTIDLSLIGPLVLPISLPLQLAGIVATLTGLGLMAWAYVVFRSFRVAARIEPGHELCSDGPFALLRHPIYTGMNIFYLGTFLMLPYFGFLLQVVANVIIGDVRARLEERVLLRAFGDQYRRYMDRTKRFLPGLY